MTDDASLPTLIQRYLKSTVFKESLTNASTAKRIALLTTIADYVLRKNTLDGLKEKIRRLYNVDVSSDGWKESFPQIEQQIHSLYQEFETDYATKLRGLYPQIIAELIYDGDRKQLDKLLV